MALWNQWACENGWSRPYGDTAASLAWPESFHPVPGGIAYAQAGDAVIWSSSLPGAEGAGHIGIYVAGAGPGRFQHFSQNFGVATCQTVESTYDYVNLVWRYPHPQQAPPSAPYKELEMLIVTFTGDPGIYLLTGEGKLAPVASLADAAKLGTKFPRVDGLSLAQKKAWS